MTDSDRPTVLHVLTALDFGGVERRMEIIAKHSTNGFMRPIFCAINGGGATESRLRASGAEVICLEVRARTPSLRAILALTRLFRRVRPRVVHTHGAEANFHGLIAARLARVPVRIGEEIGIPGHTAKAKLGFRLAYAAAQRVVAISQSVADWLIESGEVIPKKVRRIYNAVELPEAGRNASPDSTRWRLGFVGRLDRIKNPGVLVGVTHRLRQAGIPAELWIIGEGPERPDIERRIRESGLGDHVVLHGYQANPASLLRQCDVYVQPSLAEGFGLAIVEAMGCGLPVIVSARGAAREIVEPGISGWIVEGTNEEAFAEAAKAAHGLGAQKLAMVGARARESVEARFLPDRYVAELNALYVEVGGLGSLRERQ